MDELISKESQFLFNTTLSTFAHASLYILTALAIFAAKRLSLNIRIRAFALVNICAVFLFFFDGDPKQFFDFGIMLAIAGMHWALISAYGRGNLKNERIYWAALLFPIVYLVVFKVQSLLMFIGGSYLAFRMSQSVFELRSQRTEIPSLSAYFAFLFFPPTFSAGPINPLSYFNSTKDGSDISWVNIKIGLLRIIIGYIKFRYLATIAQQVTFDVQGNDFELSALSFLLLSTASYLHLYFNFSGYTDVAIGMGALLGMRIKENFDNPFLARNIIDFWRRWHISLTDFVKDAVFTPLSMYLIRSLGPKAIDFSIILVTTITFSLFALWHGLNIGYFTFYGLHAAAFIANTYTDRAVRARGKLFREWYFSNPYVRALAIIATFLFVAATCGVMDLIISKS